MSYYKRKGILLSKIKADKIQFKDDVQINDQPSKRFKKQSSNQLISDLPPEIILEILKFVPEIDLIRNISQVSKQFNNLMRDGAISLSIQLSPRLSFDFGQNFFLQRSHQISQLTFFKTPLKVLEKFSSIVGSLPKLVGIKISLLEDQLPANFLTEIFDRKLLKVLIVRGIRARPNLTNIEKCQSLTHLQLDQYISLSRLKQISTLKNLRSLELTISVGISLEDFVQIFESSNWSGLEELTVTFVTMNTESLEVIGRKCPNLVRLWIYSFCQNEEVSSSGIDFLLSSSPKLRFVFFTFNHLEESLKDCGQFCPNFDVHYSSGILPCVRFVKK